MNLSLKFSRLFLSSLLALLLFGCGSNEQQPEQAPAAEPEAQGLVPENQALFQGVVVKHQVADYNKWKAVFDADAPAREAAGINVLSVMQDKDNPKEVVVSMRANDIQKARDFAASPELKAAMQKGGVTGAPEITFFDALRFDEATPTSKDRLLIMHRVADFDAWQKVYDADAANRLASGVTDRALARGIDDPNMVLVSFVVTDMAKAKARVASPDLAATMQKAGVEGQPAINFLTAK